MLLKSKKILGKIILYPIADSNQNLIKYHLKSAFLAYGDSPMLEYPFHLLYSTLKITLRHRDNSPHLKTLPTSIFKCINPNVICQKTKAFD